jgi:hypothetical protein
LLTTNKYEAATWCRKYAVWFRRKSRFTQKA